MARLWPSLVFFGVTLSITGGIHYYLWSRLVRDLALPAFWHRVSTGILVALCLSLPLTFVLWRALAPRTPRWSQWPGYVWMGLMGLLFMTTFASDIVHRVAAWRMKRALAAADAPRDPERRLFLARLFGGAAALAGFGLGGVALVGGLRRPRVREVAVELARLPRQLDGLTIVQLTDVHVGPTIGKAFVEDLVARVNALAPDVIAITGDLVDGSVAQLGEMVAPLGGLRARHGVYFVTGNHEYYAGVGTWLPFLEKLGIRVLRNERVAIGDGAHGFDLAGIDDHSSRGFAFGHGPDLARAVAGRDPARELVLLAHQPRAIDEAEAAGVGLQLSGHTHGGQIWPWSYLVRLQQPFVRGLSRRGKTQLYVSCGTGYWGPPMRLGAPSEITRVVLKSAA
jgi:hypothetical protein